MINKIDRYIFIRLLTITVSVLAILIFIFVMIDFSENSDDFTDNGALLSEIWGDYYLNYIPEMMRLVIPVAVFTACLFITGQLSERLEIIALKAAGVSLYRLVLPFLVFAAVMTALISYLDSSIIPHSNRDRIEFEQKYIRRKTENIDKSNIYREIAKNSVLRISYYDRDKNIGYRVNLVDVDEDGVKSSITASQLIWQEEVEKWKLTSVNVQRFTADGFEEREYESIDTTLSVLPRDLKRTTSDIYQLSYKDARDYISSIERSGAGAVNVPKVQYYGRVAYPLSILVVTIIGFAVASVRRKGGKGVYIAAGLSTSFLYLAFMKISEPFGYYGAIAPLTAILLPHIFFLFAGFVLLFNARK